MLFYGRITLLESWPPAYMASFSDGQEMTIEQWQIKQDILNAVLYRLPFR